MRDVRAQYEAAKFSLRLLDLAGAKVATVHLGCDWTLAELEALAAMSGAGIKTSAGNSVGRPIHAVSIHQEWGLDSGGTYRCFEIAAQGSPMVCLELVAESEAAHG